MSWHFLPELVGLSPESSSAGDASVPWKGKRIDVNPSCGDSGTVCYPCSQSGMTPELSTDAPGEIGSTSLPPDFLASLSAQRASARGRTTLETPGPRPSESFARFDPDSRCWRTAQALLLTPTMERFSETWPQAGSMRSGYTYRRPPAERITKGRDSGSWPTLTTTDSHGHQYTYDQGDHGKPRATLTGMIRQGQLLPTLVSRGHGFDGGSHARQKARAMGLLPTLTAGEWGSNKSPSKGARRRPSISQIMSKGLLPTLLASDAKGNLGRTRGDGRPKRNLALMASEGSLPTLLARDSKGKGPADMERKSPGLVTVIGGPLNPEWAEWYMGCPIGWTGLQPLAMAGFQSWLRAHGVN